jgi:hypothetical protein
MLTKINNSAQWEMSASHGSVAGDSNCSTVSDEGITKAINDSLRPGALSFTFKKFSINLCYCTKDTFEQDSITHCISVLDCDLHPVGLQWLETQDSTVMFHLPVQLM